LCTGHATRAFPAGSPEIPVDYRGVGQPVFIPGSMGTASFLLAGGPSRRTHGHGQEHPAHAPKHTPTSRQARVGASLAFATRCRAVATAGWLPVESARSQRKDHVPTWLWIVIIVIVVLAVLGYFGRGRLSR
jgi:tRNA-splicing ligase RtcB (3'-phosphate/5'-hydroxy nucleic acid ligase)